MRRINSGRVSVPRLVSGASSELNSQAAMVSRTVEILVLVAAFAALGSARPQGGAAGGKGGDEKPMPYQFEWKVEDAPSNNFYGQNEIGNEAGRVEGKYYVQLPDGRTMTVEYTVEGDSGFVPKISFSDGAGGGKPAGR